MKSDMVCLRFGKTLNIAGNNNNNNNNNNNWTKIPGMNMCQNR